MKWMFIFVGICNLERLNAENIIKITKMFMKQF